MADQRLILKFGDREIVLAKRTVYTWISAQDDSNDLGAFLNAINDASGDQRPTVEISYEDEAWYCDPDFKFKNAP